MQNLNIETISLQGKHLIEASAGTGKTHNITRLYLRLLLERQLPVEQILVMTFTKDATEELRGRIEAFIRQAIVDWSVLIESEPLFKSLAHKISQQQALVLLKKALLFLDEAAIYTIHGFCKRVLSQHAFTSGLPFNAEMEADSKDIVLESCQDYYRILAKGAVDDFLLLADFWPDPNAFLGHFSQAIASDSSLDIIPVQHLTDSFKMLAEKAYDDFNHYHDDLVTYLVDVKKGADRELRIEELKRLTQWLKRASTETFDSLDTMPVDFIDGRRYGRSKFKAEITAIFSHVISVRDQNKTLVSDINKAKAFSIVREGIYQIRQAVNNKKQTLNMLTFDDLIRTLAVCLSPINDPDRKLANTLLAQYPVALVDEFQDTDPLQFSILKAIYYRPSPLINNDSTIEHSAIYMIGDPKQAIYGFRGGDVFAYLAARQGCDYQWLMDTNWRSTAQMVSGYNRLFYGNRLTESPKDVFGYNIPYLPVKAAKPALENSRVDNPSYAGRKALQFVHFTNVSDSAKGSIKQNFRPHMANWCADEIVKLFEYETDINAQDIAILVRDGTEAKAIKEALQSRKLSSVFLSNRANLLHSKEAKRLLVCLKGILHLENERCYTAALACGLLGFNATKLAQIQHDEIEWQTLKFSFMAYRDEWLNKGFISMALKLMHQDFHIIEKDQDRVLTNLLHLFELLQSASVRHKQPQELLFWFEQQISTDNPETEAELRLESDEDLIRIITQHGSKGLEYPVVFVPFATRYKDPMKFGSRTVNFIQYHQEPAQDDPDQKRPLILSLDGSKAAKQAMADEAYAESIRLLYVAVTRAERRCYVFSTAFDKYHLSPLGLTLKCQQDDDLLTSLQALCTDNPNDIGIIEVAIDEECEDSGKINVENEATQTLSTPHDKTPPEAVIIAKFNGKIERDWWLSSFSALSKNLRHGGVSIPDRDTEESLNSSLKTQQTNSTNVEGHVHDLPAENLLRFLIAKGAHTGNLLHDILEHTDFAAPDWLVSTKWPLVKYGELTAGFTEQNLIDWLNETLQAPLVEADCTLSKLSVDKTLRESEFYFPMNSASSDDLSKMLSQHRNTARTSNGQLISPHARSVSLPSYQKLKGMMHGFIDLIFEHNGKYYVCDYKSSYLGESFDNYNDISLKQNIEDNHYDLQYLIYSLALHRHLKRSLSNYNVEQHFGGIYYLYLRGMTNDVKHQGAGVYYRQILSSELNALDNIFLGKKMNNDKSTDNVISQVAGESND